jgi:hypothetical protein
MLIRRAGEDEEGGGHETVHRNNHKNPPWPEFMIELY